MLVKKRTGEGPAEEERRGVEERIITAQMRGGDTSREAVRGQARVYSSSRREVYL
jgi:hypothetical protein